MELKLKLRASDVYRVKPGCVQDIAGKGVERGRRLIYAEEQPPGELPSCDAAKSWDCGHLDRSGKHQFMVQRGISKCGWVRKVVGWKHVGPGGGWATREIRKFNFPLPVRDTETSRYRIIAYLLFYCGTDK